MGLVHHDRAGRRLLRLEPRICPRVEHKSRRWGLSISEEKLELPDLRTLELPVRDSPGRDKSPDLGR